MIHEVKIMNCLSNMDRITLGTDIVMNMIKMYQYRGKEFYYKEVFDNDLESISRQTVEKETIYLSKIFNVELTDARKKLLLKKDAVAKNKEEILFLNIKNMFSKLQLNVNDFEYNANQFLDFAKFLFKGVKDTKEASIGFENKIVNIERNSLIPERKQVSKREEFEKLLIKYEKMLKSENYELTLLITNFYVDFINMKPFKSDNERLGLLLLYILLFKEGFDLFKYTSFFELIYQNKETFDQNVLQANFNWDKGYSQTAPLHQQIITMLLSGYERVETLLRDYVYDIDLNKSDNIENTINKLGELFTKDELREKHPYVSDSTINRTLKRLRDENKIRPLGVGRSAKWIKLYKGSKVDVYQQLRLFGDKDED